MYAKIIALFALIAVAFAAPKPEPAPQAVVYPGGVEYINPYSAYPAVAPYAGAAVLPYSAYSAYPAYSYFVKK